MPSNIISLSEVCVIKQCGTTPDVLDDSNWNGNYPWLSSGETSSLFIFDTEKHISKKAIDNYKMKIIPRNSIVIARSGQGHTRGQVSMCMIDTFVNDGLIVIIPNLDVIDPHYLLYNLASRYDEIRQLSDANSCRGNINAKILAGMTIVLPALDIQRKIGHFLFSVDNKIRHNTQINDNLSKIVETLFSEMMQSSLLFDTTLGSIATITMGQSPPGDSLSEDNTGTLFYQGRAEFGSCFPSPRLYTTNPKRMAKEGSVLVSVRAPVGDINLALHDCCIGRGLASIESKTGLNGFIHYLLKYIKPDLDVFNGDGTVFGSITKDALNGLKISIPDEESIKQFNLFADFLDRQIRTNHMECLILIELRDYLLPRLMSGEIDVSSLPLPS